MTKSNLRQNNQTLNIAPVSFSKEKIAIGRVPYEGEEVYASLRKMYRQTHAFRFDKLDGSITNVTLSPKEGPLGVVSEEDIQHNLLLMAVAIQKSIVSWLEGRREIIKDGKHISFWGARSQYLLLSKALQDINVKPIPGIEVVTRFDIDARMFWPSGNTPDPYLGILIDIKTSNVIDLSVEELVKRKVDVIGKYVCKRSEDRLEYVRPRFELIGVINQIKDGTLLLSDTEGLDEIASREAFLEPRSENLEAVVRTLYASQANRIWSRLRELRAPLTTATGKLAQIKQTLRGLQKSCEILLGGDVQVNLGELLVSGDEQFPTQIPTNRPSLLFGPQGRKQETIPDKGIQTWGPFKYMQHTRTPPLIAIICEASKQGRVEQNVDI